MVREVRQYPRGGSDGVASQVGNLSHHLCVICIPELLFKMSRPEMLSLCLINCTKKIGKFAITLAY